ncbi:hypothetical protein HanRHA438_Chr14g0659271 [Helianthus annuus]|nr:hypothetical protein HanIR_Chr14g0703721 [Helianthus annuus]KAJ0854138.1 hypothetical protein HanRHA438_Chr14g0659271 [Helianthus annuus]
MSSPAKILLFISLLLFTTATAVTDDTTTFNHILEKYILVAIHRSLDVKSYTLNQGTGEFTVDLHRDTVNLSVGDMQFMFKSPVRGVMGKDMSSVTKLEGVSAKQEGGFWGEFTELAWSINGDSTDGYKILLSSRGYIYHDHWSFWSRVLGFFIEKMKMLVNKLLKMPLVL